MIVDVSPAEYRAIATSRFYASGGELAADDLPAGLENDAVPAEDEDEDKKKKKHGKSDKSDEKKKKKKRQHKDDDDEEEGDGGLFGASESKSSTQNGAPAFSINKVLPISKINSKYGL